jgi:Flp pilus assembly protein TadB
MLQVDWRLVETKANELYPRYKQGLTFSELEAELSAEGLDKTTVNYIVETLKKRYLEEQSKGVNVPLLVASILTAVGFVIGLALLFETGNILIVAIGMVLLFVAVRLIMRSKSDRQNTR